MSDTPMTDLERCHFTGIRNFRGVFTPAEFSAQLERELTAANTIIAQLTETITTAIASGDWKVDGSNDPDAVVRMAMKHIESTRS